MLKRHEDALMQRFDAVAQRGFAQIAWWELYLWYGASRISKTIWRDLRDRFAEVASDDGAELHIYDQADDTLLLIHSDGLKKISDRLGESE
jgi:hypothetical protein